VDVGSTTIKLVVLGQAQEILYKNYARHFSESGRALLAPTAYRGLRRVLLQK